MEEYLRINLGITLEDTRDAIMEEGFKENEVFTS